VDGIPTPSIKLLWERLDFDAIFAWAAGLGEMFHVKHRGAAMF
jgi:hypothetical protein